MTDIKKYITPSYPTSPNDLKGADKNNFTIQENLVNLSRTIEEIQKLGTDRNVIADTIINSFSYTELSYLCSNIDSFLRGISLR